MSLNSSIFRTILFGFAALTVGIATAVASTSGSELDDSLSVTGADISVGPESGLDPNAGRSAPDAPDSTVSPEIDDLSAVDVTSDALVEQLAAAAETGGSGSTSIEADADGRAGAATASTVEAIPDTTSSDDDLPDPGIADEPEHTPQSGDAPSSGGATKPAGSEPSASTDPSAGTGQSTGDESIEADSKASTNRTGGLVRVIGTDQGCTPDFCPSGIGLEAVEITETAASFVFFPIPGAEPTFVLQRARPTDDTNDPLPTVIVGESTLTVGNMSLGTEYVLTANRDFGFSAGSANETVYFQTISTTIDRYCDQVEARFEDDLIMRRDGDLYSSITEVDLVDDCGPYAVWLRSADYNHTIGYQPYQLAEQWRLEGLDRAGEVLYHSPSTPDLGEDEVVAYYQVDTMEPTGITSVRAFHTGEGSIDSVRAAATFLPANPNPRTPSLCGTLDVLFINPTLVNGIEEASRATVGMPIEAPAREYQLWLYSRDDLHANGESGGPAEQWFVEGLDADGNVVYTSPVAPDLPDDQVLGQAYVGTVNLDNIVSLRGRHLGRMGENSVEASLMLVPVDIELPDEPYPLWCKHLNLQRP